MEDDPTKVSGVDRYVVLGILILLTPMFWSELEALEALWAH